MKVVADINNKYKSILEGGRKLLIHLPTKLVVLYTGNSCGNNFQGVVISPGDGGYDIGELLDNFDVFMFEEFSGTITLSNN